MSRPDLRAASRWDPDALVFTSRRPPVPTDTGSRIRTHRLLTGLARSLKVTFVTFEHEAGSADGHVSREEVAAALPGIDVVSVPGMTPRKRLGQLRALPSAHSWTAGRYRRPALPAAVRAAISATGAAILHLDDIGVGQFVPFAGPLNVFAPADIEHRIAAQTVHAEGGGRKLYAALESWKLRREEQRVARSAGLCLAVSHEDAAALAAAGARRVALCPNGTDPVPMLPPPRRAVDEPLRIVFVGSCEYAPYARGVGWFVRDVLPRLDTRIPYTFDIVGRPGKERVAAPGVVYAGRVPSVAPWYERAHVLVVPVFEGSGSRLKIIEAMAYGRPVISTPAGAEGLPVEPGRHFVEATDAAAFARALKDVAADASSAGSALERMLLEARSAATQLFWPKIVADLLALYDAETGRPS